MLSSIKTEGSNNLLLSNSKLYHVTTDQHFTFDVHALFQLGLVRLELIDPQL